MSSIMTYSIIKSISFEVVTLMLYVSHITCTKDSSCLRWLSVSAKNWRFAYVLQKIYIFCLSIPTEKKEAG